jgi:hypothetical protein
MGVRRRGRSASYHEIAAYHHTVKAKTYAKVGFGQKAESHVRRAEWHAAFGEPGGPSGPSGPPPPPPPPQAKGVAEAKKAERLVREKEERAFYAPYVARMDASYHSAIAAIIKVTAREIEVAKVSNEQRKTGNPIERESGTIREYVRAAAEGESPAKSFRYLKAAHKSGVYEPERPSAEAEGTEGTKLTEGDPYDPSRLQMNVKAAEKSLRAFRESVEVYLRALGDKRGNGGNEMFRYRTVGEVIGRLSREWKNMRRKVEENARTMTRGSKGYIEAQRLGGAKPDFLLDVLRPALDGLERGESFLSGVEAEYLRRKPRS